MAAKNDPEVFVITRTLDAPRERVWQAWTEREHLMRWWGPKGVTIGTCDMDLRVGGTFLYSMRSADGMEMWGKWTFLEIVEPERLTVMTAFSNAEGGITRAPFFDDWPLQTRSTMSFGAQGGKTVVTIRWEAFEATEAERARFTSHFDSMRGGWGGTFDQLAEYLAGAREPS